MQEHQKQNKLIMLMLKGLKIYGLDPLRDIEILLSIKRLLIPNLPLLVISGIVKLLKTRMAQKLHIRMSSQKLLKIIQFYQLLQDMILRQVNSHTNSFSNMNLYLKKILTLRLDIQHIRMYQLSKYKKVLYLKMIINSLLLILLMTLLKTMKAF